MSKFIVLDYETTGFPPTCEVLQVSVIDQDGNEYKKINELHTKLCNLWGDSIFVIQP